MLTVGILSLTITVIAGAVYLLSQRDKLPKLVADARGIALQTVIIMVVLLAIAGGVSAVLITAGGNAVDDLENQQVTRVATDYNNETLCVAAGFDWTSTSGMSASGCR